MAILELAEEVVKKHNPLDRLDDFPEVLYASGYGDDPNQMSTDPGYLMTVNFTLQDCPGGELIDDREAVCAEEKAQNVCQVNQLHEPHKATRARRRCPDRAFYD